MILQIIDEQLKSIGYHAAVIDNQDKSKERLMVYHHHFQNKSRCSATTTITILDSSIIMVTLIRGVIGENGIQRLVLDYNSPNMFCCLEKYLAKHGV